MGALDIQWLMLPGQRPWRELHWLSLMPGARVTAVGDPRPPEAVAFVGRPYRRPTDRFVEAGAIATYACASQSIRSSMPGAGTRTGSLWKA